MKVGTALNPPSTLSVPRLNGWGLVYFPYPNGCKSTTSHFLQPKGSHLGNLRSGVGSCLDLVLPPEVTGLYSSTYLQHALFPEQFSLIQSTLGWDTNMQPKLLADTEPRVTTAVSTMAGHFAKLSVLVAARGWNRTGRPKR